MTGGDEATAFEAERNRMRARREAVGIDDAADAPTIALALSGGGIRSATFALGVMQALAEAPVPASRHPLLARFDYLSTVSGGGYIGSFFCSLFVPDRLRPSPPGLSPEEKSRDAAALAIEVLRDEPPGRMRIEAAHDGTHTTAVEDALAADRIRQPLAWLRENGRYLAPTGAGDVLYAASIAIRNWLAIQYVLASVAVPALALLVLVRAAIVQGLGLEGAIADGTLWLIGGAIVLFAAFPAGVAYWFVSAGPDRGDDEVPRRLSPASWGALAIGIGLVLATVAYAWTRGLDRVGAFATFFLVIGIQALLGFVAYAATRGGRSVAEHRVALNQALRVALQIGGLVFALALADSVAQFAYNWTVTRAADLTPPAAISAILAAVIWAVRKGAVLADGKSGLARLAKLPLDLLAGLLAAAIGFGLLVFWAVLIHWMVWNGQSSHQPFDATAYSLLVLVLLMSMLIGLVVGHFPAFINLSSLQSFYAARLTRTYLGASNCKRMSARMHSEGDRAPKGGSAAEPVDGDQLGHAAYYAPDVLAPLHVINVTVNQTTDSNEQLVQRDRKGLPLAILPTGFSIDGRFHRFATPAAPSTMAKRPLGERISAMQDRLLRAQQAPLSIGQWIGASGAAVSTGLGRTTTPGLSLLLGLANVRLGTWWESGCGARVAVDAAPRTSAKAARALARVFATQSYLLAELTAQFKGLQRPWQYLSDGGHFENTGIYELLRPERGIRLIVASDAGADVTGRFDDLANLIRLARIDHRLELVVNEAICGPASPLKDVFGRPAELAASAPRSTRKCAMLIDVFNADPARGPRVRTARIVIVKPRVIDTAPLDVQQYAATHPDFPNESTSQQFFDEAQWESYRRLGVTVGRTIFGTMETASSLRTRTLWSHLLDEPRSRGEP